MSRTLPFAFLAACAVSLAASTTMPPARTPWLAEAPSARRPWLAEAPSARRPWLAEAPSAHTPWLAEAPSARTPWLAEAPSARRPWLAEAPSARRPWLAEAPSARRRPVQATGQPATHRLEATPETVAYGYYWSEAKPALRIASGDIVDVDTLLTNTPQGLAAAGLADDRIQASLKAIETAFPRGNPNRGPGGHILTGPVFVEGAEPGDALEVTFLSIDLPIDYGYNACSGPLRQQNCSGTRTTILPLDRRTMTSQFLPGITIPLRPFFGSVGVAPAPELGRVSSNPPGRHAGNLDNRELVAGSTLWIPVFVPGALFEIGDGHAAQGDGEVDQTAIETSLRGRVQLTVRKGVALKWPRAETATDYISMGTDPDLMVATKTAIQEMVDFLAATKGLTTGQALQLTSIAGHVAVTQIVDVPNVGVHVRMPKSVFAK